MCQRNLSVQNVASLRRWFKKHFPHDPVFQNADSGKTALCKRLKQLLPPMPRFLKHAGRYAKSVQPNMGRKAKPPRRWAGLESINGLEDMIPPSFIDPVSLQIMNNPIVTTSGRSFDRSTIRQMFENKMQVRDPVDNKTMLHVEDNKPNRTLRAVISEFLTRFGGVVPGNDIVTKAEAKKRKIAKAKAKEDAEWEEWERQLRAAGYVRVRRAKIE